MAATSQIEIETTLPCLKQLPLPGWYPNIFYRPFLPEDLEAYNSFSFKPLLRYGQGNPHFELSNTQDRYLRILESSFTQGIHLAFFFKKKDQDEFELVAEGGVYMPESSWPSLYWTLLDIEINELKYWKRIIPARTQQFWWSIPRKTARLRVDIDSILQDSQGKQSPIELLCFYGTLPEGLGDSLEKYKESHWRSWSDVLVKTTSPSLENISNLELRSNRLILRPLTLEDAEALYLVLRQEKAMRSAGWSEPIPDLESTRSLITNCNSMSFQYSGLSLSLGIFLREGDNEGELIGKMLLNLWEKGWPNLAYVLKEEYWGKRFGTEFLKTFMTYWSSLPRKQVQLRMDPSDLGFQHVHEATERIEATVRLNNLASRGILRNSGFKEIPIGTDDRHSNWVFMLDL
jgi:RimJ/RimL family protein N-acetyltransferase